MKITEKTDFFKTQKSENRRITVTETEENIGVGAQPQKTSNFQQPKTEIVSISRELTDKIRWIDSVFNELNLTSASKKISNILTQARRDHFTVAVVGEFSKGKSTFINKLLGQEILPVDNLPTTAIMTRIRHSRNEVMVYVDKQGNKTKSYPLDRISWEGLTAENFGGKDAEGFSVIGFNDEWLEKSGIEIIDTPGAGDLEEARAKVIGNALLGCDGAIITVSATNALSLSEKTFIEQRLIARKTPYLMLIITKLDQVPISERATVVEYVKGKLKLWETDIPVFLPYSVDMLDDTYDDIMGMDKIKNQLSAWSFAPERTALTEEWIKAKVGEVINDELAALREQCALLEADEDKRKELIENKKLKLSDAENEWEKLNLELISRKRECFELFKSIVDRKKSDVVEKLQYEAGHTQVPSTWWNEDYPYRLKVELSNLAVVTENELTKKISEDVRWLNANLEASFKSHIIYEKEAILTRDDMEAGKEFGADIKDLSKKRTIATVGTTAVTLALAGLLASAGGFVLLATMGVGTGAKLVTDKFFKGKVEKQREQLKQLVEQSVPVVIENAIAESEKRISAVYDEIINSSNTKETEWLASQNEIIEKGTAPVNEEKKAAVEASTKKLNELAAML